MTVTLTPQESEEYFFNALCNGLGYYLGNYGQTLSFDDNEYDLAKDSYLAKLTLNGEVDQPHAVAYEDVLMEMLRMGYNLEFIDSDDDSLTKTLTLEMIHNRVQNAPFEHLSNMINENDDAETADVIIQWTLYEEIIFG